MALVGYEMLTHTSVFILYMGTTAPIWAREQVVSRLQVGSIYHSRDDLSRDATWMSLYVGHPRIDVPGGNKVFEVNCSGPRKEHDDGSLCTFHLVARLRQKTHDDGTKMQVWKVTEWIAHDCVPVSIFNTAPKQSASSDKVKRVYTNHAFLAPIVLELMTDSEKAVGCTAALAQLKLEDAFGVKIMPEEYCRGASDSVNGLLNIDASKQYSQLQSFISCLSDADPGGVYTLEEEGGVVKFAAFFPSPAAVVAQHGLGTIYLDGAHCHDQPHQLLYVASTLGPNRRAYILAWGYGSFESTWTWTTFVNVVKKGLENNSLPPNMFTFLTDRNDGAINALSSLNHFFCSYHIAKNVYAAAGPADANNAYYLTLKAATAGSRSAFTYYMSLMETNFPVPFEKLSSIEPRRWALSHAPDGVFRADQYTTNPVEGLNNRLNITSASKHQATSDPVCRARGAPIVLSAASILQYVSNTAAAAKEEARSAALPPTGLTATMRDRLRVLEAESRGRKLSLSGTSVTVSGGRTAASSSASSSFRVALREKTCSCGHWQGTGYPCVHAIAAIQAHGDVAGADRDYTSGTWIHPAWSQRRIFLMHSLAELYPTVDTNILTKNQLVGPPVYRRPPTKSTRRGFEAIDWGRIKATASAVLSPSKAKTARSRGKIPMTAMDLDDDALDELLATLTTKIGARGRRELLGQDELTVPDLAVIRKVEATAKKSTGRARKSSSSAIDGSITTTSTSTSSTSSNTGAASLSSPSQEPSAPTADADEPAPPQVAEPTQFEVPDALLSPLLSPASAVKLRRRYKPKQFSDGTVYDSPSRSRQSSSPTEGGVGAASSTRSFLRLSTPKSSPRRPLFPSSPLEQESASPVKRHRRNGSRARKDLSLQLPQSPFGVAPVSGSMLPPPSPMLSQLDNTSISQLNQLYQKLNQHPEAFSAFLATLEQPAPQ